MAVDRNVPAGAAKLLDFIGSIEAPKGYGTIYGNNQAKLPKPLTSMTLDEVEASQASWTKRFGSSACGRYQFMRNTLDAPGTLRDIEGEMGLTGKEKFSPKLQDLMGFHLLKRRGYPAFVAGKLSRTAFGLHLAQEWASLPVLAPVRGAHRKLARGQTYYAGDALNKVLTSPESVEDLLDAVLRLDSRARKPEAPVPATLAPAKAEPAPEQDTAQGDPLVWAIQKQLLALGYPEVGTIDGNFGTKTRGAILAFEADNGLPLTGVASKELLTEALTANPRVLSPARTEATPKEVRAEVPEAKTSFFAKIAGAVMAGLSAVGAFISGLVDNLDEAREMARPFTDFLSDLPPWLWFLLIGGGALWLFWNGRKGEKAVVAAYRDGERR